MPPPKLNSQVFNRFSDMDCAAPAQWNPRLRPGGGCNEPLDDNLKQLMKELEQPSTTRFLIGRISEAIAKIRSSGYDVFLVLEATIGFNRRQETSADESAETVGFDGEAQLNITSQDVKFLKSLKISIDDREVN
jgi:hypothetical protein